MANNPYVNKVKLADGTTVMDISDTTATAEDVDAGIVFYTASGARSTGTAANVKTVTMNGTTLTPVSGDVNLGTVITSNPVMTGATSSAAGTSGLVTAPAAGEDGKYLKGDGSWDFAASKAFTITFTATNTSGAYTHTEYDARITSDMRPANVYFGTDGVFTSDVTVTTGNGSITVSCDDVAGSSTVDIILFCPYYADPTEVSSTEFDVLSNRIGTLASLETESKGSVVAAINELVEKVVYSSTEPSNPVTGMIWLKPAE